MPGYNNACMTAWCGHVSLSDASSKLHWLGISQPAVDKWPLNILLLLAASAPCSTKHIFRAGISEKRMVSFLYFTRSQRLLILFYLSISPHTPARSVLSVKRRYEMLSHSKPEALLLNLPRVGLESVHHLLAMTCS